MKSKAFLIVIIVILLIGIAGSVLVLTSPSKSRVRVLSDQQVVYTADLNTAQDTTFDVPFEDHVNTIEVRDHQIRVRSADCSDQTCVHMGWLKSASMPIVCLPHRLVIEFTDEQNEIDAVTR
ncbi:MAG TPA: NusG domain II-containing protein [Ruminococcaceae bacterium]|nr:NusG domain II-containing protein [Oscillospiraceae bacterium]